MFIFLTITSFILLIVLASVLTYKDINNESKLYNNGICASCKSDLYICGIGYNGSRIYRCIDCEKEIAIKYDIDKRYY